MNIEEVRLYCINKPCVSEETPFGPDVLVYKLMGKVFLLLALDHDRPSFNVKCNPEWAIQLREEHAEVVPGYHMNKKHWNTIYLDGFLSDELIVKCINHSYKLIYDSLPKKYKEELKNEY
jgi:predicted DNA-binding protein (MmcQ/YjbR family)